MRFNKAIVMRMIAAAAGALAGAALVLAVAQVRAARAAQAGLLEEKRRRESLQPQVAEWEAKLRAMERRAADSERDTADLLKAVNARRAESAAPRPAAPVGGGVALTVESTDSRHTEPEKIRLAQERAYQQDLAKHRAGQARARAEFDLSLAPLDAAAKYARLMERAHELAANAEFQQAVRVFNEAMQARPPHLAMSERDRALQVMLQGQNTPVDVTFLSDGQTFVSIRHTRAPALISSSTAVRLLPGNYEVIGRRPGYRDVLLLLQVRSGTPAPVVTVQCTRPVEK